MKKRTWIYVTIAIIALIGVFAVGVYAAPSVKSGGIKGGFKARKAERVGRLLGITDEQRSEIVSILEKNRGEFRPLVEGMFVAQRDLRNAVMSDKFNEAAIRKASDEVGEYRAEIAVLAGKVYQDVSKVLTPEQKDLINEFVELRQNHVSEMLEFLEKMPGK